MKTTIVRKEDADRKWYLIDASGQTLGRMATAIARILRGKNKPTFCPFLDNGDFVIVTNAMKIAVTGNKASQKKYYRHTQYPGGLKVTDLKDMLADKPDYVIRHAVKGMMPKKSLGRAQLNKLKVYAGDSHPHAAQLPIALSLS